MATDLADPLASGSSKPFDMAVGMGEAVTRLREKQQPPRAQQRIGVHSCCQLSGLPRW